MRGRWIAGPLGLAVIVTLVNALKPDLIDDTAYLAFARHIAAQPLDPYGFTLHWYTLPDRAMDILAPPILLYWLALGIRIFGEHLFVLKLWLFPFLWLFTGSLDVLLKRFANGTERFALPLIVLSPAVLPTVNLMLDIPAAALGLAAVAVFTRRNVGAAVFAGLLAGLAMQTKYTAMLAPAAILGYGLTHRQFRLAILAGAVSVAVFASWEGLLVLKYGESHFLHHVADQRAATGNWLQEKSALIPGLAGHLGCLGFGIALVGMRALGVRGRAVAAVAVVWSVGFLLVVTLPGEMLRARNIWRTAGTVVMLVAAAGSVLLLVNVKGRRLRLSRGSWFAAGWLLLEVAGYFVLTPFPAARRVIGFTLVLGILAARLLSRVQRIRPERIPSRWMLPFGIATGLLVAALDTYDAYPEEVLAERAAAQLHGESKVWFAGHWGFQYYCERAGFTMIVPGQTVLQPGDVIVLPIHLKDDSFGRPHIGLVPIRPPKDITSPLARELFDDHLAGRTIPNFYGGNDPIEGTRGPRLEVSIERVVKSWAVPGP